MNYRFDVWVSDNFVDVGTLPFTEFSVDKPTEFFVCNDGIGAGCNTETASTPKTGKLNTPH